VRTGTPRRRSNKRRNQLQQPTYESFKREAPVAELKSNEATQRIFDRLTGAQIERIVASITPDESATLNISSNADRMRGIISLAAYYRDEEALAAMRMPAALPPDEVHAMSRGPFTLAGGCKYADMVVESLGGGQPIMRKGARVLDFRCSSGRVVRMLAAAYPEVEWHGCDPMPDSIRWDQENLPSIKFTVSSADPPLSAYSDEMLDLVFAISIWSHFAENAALRWLEEMRRIVKPGGFLVLTTHGFRAIDYLAEKHLYDVKDLAHIRDSMYSSGLCFLPVFGKKGDWGIVNSEWGQTFISPEWLLAHACPAWTVTEYGLGRVENNQDIYTLQRV
jgi:SAM-dependent methyltransferase